MVWQNIFSGWKNLLRTECCMCFSEWLLSLSFWKHEGNFLRYSLWEPGRTPRDKKVLGSPLRLICPAVFNSQTCPQWASSKFDNYILIFYTLILVSTEVSVSWASMVSCVSLFSSLYLNFGSNALSCDGFKKRSFFKFVQLFFFFFGLSMGITVSKFCAEMSLIDFGMLSQPCIFGLNSSHDICWWIVC